jgi:hypothetical protein
MPVQIAPQSLIPFPGPGLLRRWVESPAASRQGKPCRPASSIAGVVTREPEVGLCQSTPNHHSHPDWEPSPREAYVLQAPSELNSPSVKQCASPQLHWRWQPGLHAQLPARSRRPIPFNELRARFELPAFVRHVLKASQQIKVCNLEAD